MWTEKPVTVQMAQPGVNRWLGSFSYPASVFVTVSRQPLLFISRDKLGPPSGEPTEKTISNQSPVKLFAPQRI